MGPIVDAVSYVIINEPELQHRWIDYVDNDKVRRALRSQSGFAQHRQDVLIMRTKVAETLLKRSGF